MYVNIYINIYIYVYVDMCLYRWIPLEKHVGMYVLTCTVIFVFINI